MALDLQDLKISSQEAQTRASTCHQKVRWSPASFHTRTRIDADLSLADHSSPWFLTRSHAPLQCYDVMMSSPSILGLTRLSSRPGFKSRSPNTRLHVPPEGPVITSIISCAHTHRRGPFMRKSLVSIIPHTLTRALPVLWCHDVVTLHTRFNPFIQLTRFEPDWPDSNCLKKKRKKKERERKEKALTNWTFDFDQKSQNFQKGPVPLSFSRTFQF